MDRDTFFSALDDLFKDFYCAVPKPLTQGYGDVLRAKVLHLVGVYKETQRPKSDGEKNAQKEA